jgi:UDP-N-acetylmuramoyl-tripeptide--D-alanyl-D-alanine ligase
MKLWNVLEALTGSKDEALNLEIHGGCIDSRKAATGNIFVALPGESTDGHNYIQNAFENGAAIALIQKEMPFPTLDLRPGRFSEKSDIPDTPFCIRVDDSLAALQTIARYWRQQLDLKVIGITGSVGKSTTKELVAGVLSQRYHVLKNIGNFNNEIGLPLTLLEINESHECAVLEMGFFVPGEITFLCEIAQPHIGVLTNIGHVHAERAGSIEEIAKGKSELVQALPQTPTGTAILNYDDPWVRQMVEKTHANVFFYGLDAKADLWADNIKGRGLDGISFTLHHQDETFNLRVPLIGRHSVHTALRAAAVGLACGMTWEEIINGLKQPHTQLRMITRRTSKGALIIDDTYNASPASTLAALNLLEEIKGRKIAVLGDMLELGSYEEEGHIKVGIRAADICDQLITVGELGKIIADAAKEAGMDSSKIISVDKTLDALPCLRDILSSGDVVLIKGSRGLKMEDLVANLEVING